MTALRVILCKVGDKPRVTWLDADPGGDHAVALGRLLGVPVARLTLLDGVELCCDRDGLLLGLALARRALAMFTFAPQRAEGTIFPDGRNLGLGLNLDEWPVSGDFLLTRVAAGGELVDLTESDVGFWMFWLGLDYVLHR
jgi:hypothetical protein